MSLRDLVRFESNERVDLGDMLAFQQNMRSDIRASFAQIMLDSGNNRVLGGYAVTEDSGGPSTFIEVNAGTALGSHVLQGGTQEYGVVFGDEAPALQTLDFTGRPAATYNIYVRFSSTPGSSANRIFWNTATNQEEVDSIETREVISWDTEINTVLPGPEYFKVAEVIWDGISVDDADVTQTRIMYFEGNEAGGFANNWGTGNDRDADRGLYGINDFRQWTSMLRTQLSEFMGGGKAWHDAISVGVEDHYADNLDPHTDTLVQSVRLDVGTNPAVSGGHRLATTSWFIDGMTNIQWGFGVPLTTSWTVTWDTASNYDVNWNNLTDFNIVFQPGAGLLPDVTWTNIDDITFNFRGSNNGNVDSKVIYNDLNRFEINYDSGGADLATDGLRVLGDWPLHRLRVDNVTGAISLGSAVRDFFLMDMAADLVDMSGAGQVNMADFNVSGQHVGTLSSDDFGFADATELFYTYVDMGQLHRTIDAENGAGASTQIIDASGTWSFTHNAIVSSTEWPSGSARQSGFANWFFVIDISPYMTNFAGTLRYAYLIAEPSAASSASLRCSYGVLGHNGASSAINYGGFNSDDQTLPAGVDSRSTVIFDLNQVIVPIASFGQAKFLKFEQLSGHTEVTIHQILLIFEDTSVYRQLGGTSVTP